MSLLLLRQPPRLQDCCAGFGYSVGSAIGVKLKPVARVTSKRLISVRKKQYVAVQKLLQAVKEAALYR